MIIRGNSKSAKTNLNASDLEKVMGKEVDHGWSLPLKIDLIHHINNTGVFPLGVADPFSINDKGERYTKRCLIN